MTSASTPAASGFRPDVEGLRAVAVGTVLWYHATLPFVGGGFAGVDIFFVISGFLITGQLLREVERDGRISLVRFYGRRAKRLFPAAATVLLTTAVLTWAFLPRFSRGEFGGDITAAAAYVVNWRLAARSVDYLAEDVGASPVQHFWSLAVEEQFYIVWPLLILVLAVLIRRGHVAVRPGMALGLALITVPSLAWSIRLTALDPARAYFVTTTRLWELGIGALVAVGALVWTKLHRGVALAVAWGGLGLIILGLALQSTSTAWPGTAALVPTLGAAGVILGGFAAGPRGPVALLGRRFPVWVGALSYSLYLWHWPFVVVAKEITDFTPLVGAAAVLASAAPAWLTYRFIENPVRYHPRVSASARIALGLGLACSLLGVAAGAGVGALAGTTSYARVPPAEAKGGEVLGQGQGPSSLEIDMHPTSMTPDPFSATKDVPALYARRCQGDVATVTPKRCEFGVPGSEVTVALVGDSKIAQWLPAIEVLAQERGWTIATYTKSTCPWTAALLRVEESRYTACQKWGRAVLDRLTGPDAPDVVLTSGIRGGAYATPGKDDPTSLIDGYVEYWAALGRKGIPVIAIADTPQPGFTVYRCVADHPDDFMTRCRGDWNEGIGTAPLEAAAGRVDTAHFVTMNDWICPEQTCWPVIGKVLVWRQGSHITATYARTLAPELGRRIDPVVSALD